MSNGKAECVLVFVCAWGVSEWLMGSHRPFHSLETCVTFLYSIKIHMMSEQIGQQSKTGGFCRENVTGAKSVQSRWCKKIQFETLLVWFVEVLWGGVKDFKGPVLSTNWQYRSYSIA